MLLEKGLKEAMGVSCRATSWAGPEHHVGLSNWTSMHNNSTKQYARTKENIQLKYRVRFRGHRA
jgi:hypothetical protein